MVETVQTDVEASYPVRETSEFLRIFNELVKRVEELRPSQEELNKSMKDHAAIIATMTANSRELNEQQKKQLSQTRLALQAEREVSSRRKEASKAEQENIRRTIALIKERQTIAQNLAKAQQQREEVQKTREQENIQRALRNIALSQQRGRELARATREATKAQDEQRRSLDKLIRSLTRWGAGSATVFFLYRRLRREIEETVREIVGNTQEFEDLTVAAGELRRSVALAVISLDDMKQDLAEINALFTATRELVTLTSATFAGLGAIIDTLDIPGVGLLEVFTQPTVTGIAAAAIAFGELTDEVDTATAFWDAFNEKVKDVVDNMKAATDETKDLDSAIQSLVNQSIRFDKAMADNVQSLRDIQSEFQKTIITVQNEATQALQEIESDLTDSITEINAEALEARQDAFDNFNKSIERAQKRANKSIVDNQKRHQLEMQFAQKRHNLTMLQNQRIFEFERELLVAEGDVLAIEQLDARHKLEQQAAEENFRLQMQQAEAMFRLQAQILSDAIRDQIGELRAGLAERLAEIEEERRLEVEEAEKRAEELRQQEQEAATRRFIDAELEKNARIKQVEDQWEAVLEATAEALAELAHGTKTDPRIVFDAWEQVMGPNALLQNMFETRYASLVQLTRRFISEIEGLTGGFDIGTGTGRRRLRGRRGGPPPFPSFQFGGDFIASQPQLIEVGHGPERVTVQPLSAIGMVGNVTHRWGGGAIPVQGQGSVSGVDFNALGNQIARGTVSALRTRMRETRGQRGT